MMAVRATSSWEVATGTLASLAEVVAAEEDWEGEAEDVGKCVRLEGEGRGELVLEASPGKVSFLLTIDKGEAEVLADSDYLSLSRYLSF